MTSIEASTTHTVKVKKQAGIPRDTLGVKTITKKTASKKTSVGGCHRGNCAPLRPATLTRPEAVKALLALDEEQGCHEHVHNLFRQTLGEKLHVDRSKPHAASTTQDCAGAAANLALPSRILTFRFVSGNARSWMRCS